MLLLIFKWLASLGWVVPAAFSYASTRMLLAALTALFFMLLVGPYGIKKLYELKTGQSIRVEDCPLLAQLHEKKKNTPTMGGVLILVAMLAALALWMDWSSSYTLILGVTTVWLGSIGAYDDYLKLKHKNSKGLCSKKKLFLQIILGALVAMYTLFPGIAQKCQMGTCFAPPVVKEVGRSESSRVDHEAMRRYYVPFYKKPVVVVSGIGVIAAALMTLVVIAGASNAVNLTDGLDGLAAGCVILVASVLGLVAFVSNHIDVARYLHILYFEGSSEIAVFMCATVGACLGFLWYNGYPAQVFMGDTGSLALGGVLGVAAVLLRREVLLALVGGVLVVEALSVILQVASFRWRHQRRVFLCAPLHHHFEYLGWHETKVVLRFWIVGLILAVVGLISLKVQ